MAENSDVILQSSLGEFTKRTAIAIALASLAVVLLVSMYQVASLLLLLFAALLVGVLLQGISSFIEERTPVPYKVALGLVMLVGLGLTVLGSWLIFPAAADQMQQFSQQLPEAIAKLKESLAGLPGGQALASYIPVGADSVTTLLAEVENVAPRLARFFTSSFGAIGDFVIIFVVGLFLAVDPGLYRDGLLRLFPTDKRDRTDEVIHEVVSSLQGWLTGRLSSMLLIGVIVGLGLWALGVPFAFTLGLLAGLFSLVPNFGPILAFIPAFLIAWMHGGISLALYVMLFYGAAQGVESYVITPLIQKKATSVPPAMLLSMQVLLGFTAGLIGLLVATPLLVALIVLVKEIYVEEVVEPVSLKG